MLAISATGKVTVIKDRYGNVDEAEVTLIRRVTKRETQTFTTSPSSTLNLASQEEINAEMDSMRDLSPVVLRRSVALTASDIRAALDFAIDADQVVVKISGEKVDGRKYVDRAIRPVAITKREVGYGREDEYVLCIDVESGGERSFKLSGIEKVEV